MHAVGDSCCDLKEWREKKRRGGGVDGKRGEEKRACGVLKFKQEELGLKIV